MDSDSPPSPSPTPPPSPSPLCELKRLKRSSDAPGNRTASPLPPPNDSKPDPCDPTGEGEGDTLEPLFRDVGRFTGCDAGDLGQEVASSEEEEEEEEKKKKSAKKRLSLDGDEEGDKQAQKRRRRKGDGEKDGHDSKRESVREKRKLEKERKDYLELLHVESQRLLRETKNASFKPARLVQKPVSSVLEKIRLRKLEMLKSTGFSAEVDGCENVDYHGSDTTRFPCGEDGHFEGVEKENIVVDNVHVVSKGFSDEDARHGMHLDNDCENANHSSEIAMLDSRNSPVKQEENRQLGKQPDNPPENIDVENNVRSQPTTSSKYAVDSTYETSSDDEDCDKENTCPLKSNTINFDLFGKTDLAKPFVDDEAEEEDDSDHDLMRFPEEDEDDGGEESEELNDLVATDYEEMPLDQERRNRLHQEWLEQKDAAETHKMLQRLKHNQRKEDGLTRPPNEHVTEDLDEEPVSGGVSANAARENSNKAKQMMAKMFDAKDDGFLSSDDEETERLSRQQILEQSERTSIVTLDVDTDSREVFSLIKKMNIAPDPNKRTKPITTTYEPLYLCGSSNNSSKSSFLGRATSNSLQPSHKQSNPTTVKSFVFGRDDSNSRSAISKSEHASGSSDQREAQQIRAAGSARFTAGSQPQSLCSKSVGGTDSGSGSSLFEILRRSSVLYDQKFNAAKRKSAAVVSETQAARQLTAFKLGNKLPKRQA